MEYNTCKTCGACNGAAGNLVNGNCWRCREKPRKRVAAVAVYNMECGVCKEPCTESELVRVDCKDMLMCEVCINELVEELRNQANMNLCSHCGIQLRP